MARFSIINKYKYIWRRIKKSICCPRDKLKQHDESELDNSGFSNWFEVVFLMFLRKKKVVETLQLEVVLEFQ